MGTTSYESVLHQADTLSREEKLRLIRELAISAEDGSTAPGERSVMELAGLGAELWNGVDGQEYVHRERASWNG
jgi:hypothetical protein